MRRKRFSAQLKALSAEKKVILVATVVTLLSCFMPWYGINSRVVNEWWSAFGSIGSVGGYLIAAFSLLSIFLILAPLTESKLDISKKLPWKPESLLLFFSGQSFFVTLIFVPVYAQYSLFNASNSGARFGIYLALASSLVATIVALSSRQKSDSFSLQQQEFAHVPKTHSSLEDEWNERRGTEVVIEEPEEESFEQESLLFQEEEKTSDPIIRHHVVAEDEEEQENMAHSDESEEEAEDQSLNEWEEQEKEVVEESQEEPLTEETEEETVADHETPPRSLRDFALRPKVAEKVEEEKAAEEEEAVEVSEDLFANLSEKDLAEVQSVGSDHQEE